MIQKTADENTLCYFCYQPLDPDEEGARRTSEHHVNFPKGFYSQPKYEQRKVWCHQSCQQSFHRAYEDYCKDVPDVKLKCESCNPVWAIVCLYNKTRYREIDEDELTQILFERKWLAEAEEKARTARRRQKVYTPQQVFATE
ncbi:MAG: hypothetical protein WCI63_01430 [bacterium]